MAVCPSREPGCFPRIESSFIPRICGFQVRSQNSRFLKTFYVPKKIGKSVPWKSLDWPKHRRTVSGYAKEAAFCNKAPGPQQSLPLGEISAFPGEWEGTPVPTRTQSPAHFCSPQTGSTDVVRTTIHNPSGSLCRQGLVLKI